jgi:hypothetical protein
MHISYFPDIHFVEILNFCKTKCNLPLLQNQKIEKNTDSIPRCATPIPRCATLISHSNLSIFRIKSFLSLPRLLLEQVMKPFLANIAKEGKLHFLQIV